MNRRLTKSTRDVKVNGVCAGIAEYFGIDPTIVRVIWAIASLSTAGFPGLVLYFVLAVVIPKDTDVYPNDYNQYDDNSN